MRAKEEILYQHLDAADIMYTKGKYIDDQDVEPIIFKAMDEYAKEIAIAFLEYCVNNHSVDYEGFGLPVWENSGTMNVKEITNDELFEKFITSQNQKNA